MYGKVDYRPNAGRCRPGKRANSQSQNRHMDNG
nr:MAG TPA: hypothetical protein [Caudoviricetes sp.]